MAQQKKEGHEKPQQLIVSASPVSQPAPKGVVEKTLSGIGLHKTIPEILRDSVAQNESVSIAVETPRSSVRVSHTPPKDGNRRELVVRVESDD